MSFPEIMTLLLKKFHNHSINHQPTIKLNKQMNIMTQLRGTWLVFTSSSAKQHIIFGDTVFVQKNDASLVTIFRKEVGYVVLVCIAPLH